MKLHPNQIENRKRFIDAIPSEDDRMAAAIMLAVTSSALSTFIVGISQQIEVPYEIKYRCALLLNFCMGVFHPKIKIEGHVLAKYKEELSKQDIDDRFQIVFKFIFEEAKKQGWVQ